MSSKIENRWFVYFVRCNDDSLYCGVTTDIARREREHNETIKGAKYTRVRRPVTMVYQLACTDRSAACKEEARLKKLSKAQKEALIHKEAIS